MAGQPTVTYTYDAANRLTQLTQGSATVTLTYDAAGRRTSLTLPNAVVVNSAYDAASRLTALTYTQGATVLGTLTYTYDAAGNRTDVGGTWVRTGQPNAMTGASYDVANRQLTFGGATLTYDLNGNLTSDGVTTYTWNARNQLTALSAPGLTASFVYDGLGRRLRKTINGAATDVLYDGLTPVQELSGTTILATMLTGLGIDEVFTRTDAAGTRALLTDALGSTVALTDPTGTVQTEYTYEPFGATTATSTLSSNPFQYTGRENDGTGLYYYRARYYHPGLQRFISEDPFNLGSARLLKQQNEFSTGICQKLQRRPQELNLYGYVRNNPMNIIDPQGLFSIDIGGALQVGIIDLTIGITTGLGASLTTPGLGAGGFVCINLCKDPPPPPPPPRKDPPPSPQPFTYTAGPGGRRLSISFSDDFCNFCFNFGPSVGFPVNIGVPIQIR